MPNQFSFDELNTFSKDELISYIKRKHRERHPDREEDDEEEQKERSLPYREYFGDMYLEPEEKERRIQMAEDMEFIFLFLFAWTLNNDGIVSGDITYSYVYKVVEERCWEAVRPYVEQDQKVALSPETRERLNESIRDYISRQTRYVVDNTDDHIRDDYFTSPDRARMISENQVNGIANDQEMYEAFEGGYTSKTWVTMEDNRVRDTHVMVDGETIPIEEPFMVGDSLLLFPGDITYDPSPEEISNCRCHVEYGFELFDDMQPS